MVHFKIVADTFILKRKLHFSVLRSHWFLLKDRIGCHASLKRIHKLPSKIPIATKVLSKKAPVWHFVDGRQVETRSRELTPWVDLGTFISSAALEAAVESCVIVGRRNNFVISEILFLSHLFAALLILLLVRLLTCNWVYILEKVVLLCYQLDVLVLRCKFTNVSRRASICVFFQHSFGLTPYQIIILPSETT